MAPRKRSDVHSALIRKGFVLSETDHHKLVYFTLDHRKTSVWTKTSHGTSYKDIADPNLARMARQCRLSSRDFARLLDCPLSREDYEEMLLAAGQIAASTKTD